MLIIKFQNLTYYYGKYNNKLNMFMKNLWN